MKAVIIYGPPAVGKFTVAKALSEITGYQILENHLISDLILSIFRRNTPTANILGADIRNLVFQAAARNNFPGLINTFLFNENKRVQQETWCRQFLALMSQDKVPVAFIRLYCDVEQLKLRVIDPSRAGTKKVNSVEKLLAIIDEEKSQGEIAKDIGRGLSIDNTNLNPHDVARLIKSYFKL